MRTDNIFKDSLLIIDVETTGVDYKNSSIIQLGAAIMYPDGTISSRGFNCPIKPYTNEWTEQSERIHKISYEEIMNIGSPVESALGEFIEYCKEGTVLDLKKAYTLGQWAAGFDVTMLYEAFVKNGLEFPFYRRSFDIASIARFFCALNYIDYNSSLHEIANKMRVKTHDLIAHNAKDDALLTARVLQKIIELKKTLNCF